VDLHQFFQHFDRRAVEHRVGQRLMRAVRRQQCLLDYQVDGRELLQRVMSAVQLARQTAQLVWRVSFRVVDAHLAQAPPQPLAGIGILPQVQPDLVLDLPFRDARQPAGQRAQQAVPNA
jgi:hypothetical protein